MSGIYKYETKRGTYLGEEWLPSIRPRSGSSGRRHRGTVSAATHDRYATDLARYVIPRVGDVPLRKLTPAILDEIYDDLERAGGQAGRPLSPKTVSNLHNLLHKALADAVKRGRLRRSPADGVSPPTATKARTRWWTIDELRAFLLHVEEDELHPAFLLLVTTGARLGEVAGLTWEDLDLDAGMMRVEWTLGHIGHQLTWKARPKARQASSSWPSTPPPSPLCVCTAPGNGSCDFSPDLCGRTPSPIGRGCPGPPSSGRGVTAHPSTRGRSTSGS